ncbi:Protein regulator of cytokinesis 1 [Histomonas meleagridis]|uniref:Protein regulator of cytokinesis 1 n=1 Tax=Histomonas meleagridis TaxID=135588 RepID=UPI00355A571B|nr:Protein regulator of cytokinesis 1 [Histomonas meleagridis]KAH0805805.1 Protein regulator of cytokinesis 1 [Histomonas meleagridis]
MEDSLIKFKIDPSLISTWKAIGYSEEEQVKEIKKLNLVLNQSYQNFIKEATERKEKIKEKLSNLQDAYEQRQFAFGENLKCPRFSGSLKHQIKQTKKAIEDLEAKYQTRIQKFNNVQIKIDKLFQKLGFTEEEKDDLAYVGDTDLTKERLQRYYRRISNLKDTKDQNKKLFYSNKKHIIDICDQLNEEIPTDIQQIFENEIFSDSNISILNEALNKLEQTKEERSQQIQELIEQIQYLYVILAIDKNDQIEFPTDLSIDVIKTLKNEVSFLQDQQDSRLPQVAKALRKEIIRLCDDLRVPNRNRPKLKGNTSIEEEVVYLRKKYDELNQQRIKSQPIIELITQIERIKDTLKNKNIISKTQKISSAKQMIEEERKRRKEIEQLPKLQKKLLQLLYEFRDENGYDFEFNGVKFIDALEIDVFDDLAIQPKTTDINREMLLKKIRQAESSKPDLEEYKAKTNKKGMREKTVVSLRSRKPFY